MLTVNFIMAIVIPPCVPAVHLTACIVLVDGFFHAHIHTDCFLNFFLILSLDIMAPKVVFKWGDNVDLISVAIGVGQGKVFQTSPTKHLHNDPFPKECVGVNILKCEQDNSTISYPPRHEDDLTLLQKCVGYMIAWPIKGLLVFCFLTLEYF